MVTLPVTIHDIYCAQVLHYLDYYLFQVRSTSEKY